MSYIAEKFVTDNLTSEMLETIKKSAEFTHYFNDIDAWHFEFKDTSILLVKDNKATINPIFYPYSPLLNITSEIFLQEIHRNDELEKGRESSYGEWFHVSAEIACSMNINGEKHTIHLQNGHFYENNDYSRPTNCLTIYEEGTSKLVNLIMSFEEFADSQYKQERLLEILEEIKERNLTNHVKRADNILEIYEAIQDEIRNMKEIMDPKIEEIVIELENQ